jgi:hypothetical protein
MDNIQYSSAKESLLEAYRMLAPTGMIEELNKSVRLMEAENKSRIDVLAFIASCVQVGLILERW